jgi:hypothetical protein
MRPALSNTVFARAPQQDGGLGGVIKNAVGNAMQEVRVELELTASATQLSQVVVTGTAGAAEKRTIGNSITQVNVAELASKTTLLNVSEALQSKTPGVTILMAAHRALESITMDREVTRLRDSLGSQIAESIYYGFWFAPEFEILRKMIDETQTVVNGDVRLKLYSEAAHVILEDTN